MRPVRISSEGPEVVPDPRHESPDKYLVPFPEIFDRPPMLFKQKQPDEREPEPAIFTPPLKGYDLLPYGAQDNSRPNRSFGLITTLILALVCFLIGGGIGGGVGGAIAVKNQAKISR
jgi:hypothetical protein